MSYIHFKYPLPIEYSLSSPIKTSENLKKPIFHILRINRLNYSVAVKFLTSCWGPKDPWQGPIALKGASSDRRVEGAGNMYLRDLGL